MIIAIDGPSGAGKSTVAKQVAVLLGFACLDTGAMYRSVAWRAIRDDVSLDDEQALESIAATCPIEFRVQEGSDVQRVYIDGDDVTEDIRSAQIDHAVSPISALAQVRRALVAQQQRIGRAGDFVVEGRDIGTAVFPDAEVKVFLTASAQERARRRVAQNEARGFGPQDYETVLAEIERRDQIDTTREESPLVVADDAVVIDSTDLDIAEVIEQIRRLAGAAQAG